MWQARQWNPLKLFNVNGRANLCVGLGHPPRLFQQNFNAFQGVEPGTGTGWMISYHCDQSSWVSDLDLVTTEQSPSWLHSNVETESEWGEGDTAPRVNLSPDLKMLLNTKNIKDSISIYLPKVSSLVVAA